VSSGPAATCGCPPPRRKQNEVRKFLCLSVDIKPFEALRLTMSLQAETGTEV
jgi:hypothetical protein